MKPKPLELILLWVFLTGLLLLSTLVIRSSPTNAASTARNDEVLIKDSSLTPNQQTSSPDGIWRDVPTLSIQSLGQRDIVPTQYRLVEADMAALDNLLAQAPQEAVGGVSGQSAPLTLILPMPDGSFQRFRIEEYAMLKPPHPDITTYRAYGLDDPTAVGNLDRTPAGFHAMILTAADAIFIDPYSQGDITHYLSFYQKDQLPVPWNPLEPEKPGLGLGAQNIGAAAHVSFGNIRREYDLIVGITQEFTNLASVSNPGDDAATKKNKAFAVATTTINRVNVVYEREFNVRLHLINNQTHIYSAEPDGYTNNNPSTLLTENQTKLDGLGISYDIGHVFAVNGSGLGSLNSVCSSDRKARGTSASDNPTNDAFYINMVSHEIGHQFGANHSFNASNPPSCGNRNASTAYEPGGGITIMSYAGICSNQNIENNSIEYFHAISFNEIAAHITDNDDTSFGFEGGDTCDSEVSTAPNTAPQVEAGLNYTIPFSTPFVLTGSATDATVNGALTYSWEQFESGQFAPWDGNAKPFLPNNDQDAARPIFRTFAPITYTHRNFPTMANIVGKSYQNNGEILPVTARTIPFRLTVRDNQGGIAHDEMSVTINTATGPFRVTSPAGSEIWTPASQQTITWNVANTTNAPVNCANVNILMSTDGGLTFPIILASNTPNDGSEAVILTAAAIGAVIKVQCADNIFFDATSVVVCTPLFSDDHEAVGTTWTTSNGAGSNSWTRQTNAANAKSGTKYWFINNNGGTDTDSYLVSPTVNASTNNFLRFFHKYNLETGYDGGVVEINVNGGGWNRITKNKFTQNGYNATMRNDSFTPLQSQDAFTGDSGGYIASIVDLATLVSNGQNFQIRFREVNDQTGAVDGWYVDDVLVCSVTQPNIVNLVLTKTASASSITAGGGVLTYTLVAQNNGTATATSVVLTDTVPVSTTLDATSLSGDANEVAGLITWNTGADLPQGQSLTRTFVVTVSTTVTTGNQIINTAYVTATNAPAGKNSSATTTVGSTGGGTFLPIIIKN